MNKQFNHQGVNIFPQSAFRISWFLHLLGPGLTLCRSLVPILSPLCYARPFHDLIELWDFVVSSVLPTATLEILGFHFFFNAWSSVTQACLKLYM